MRRLLKTYDLYFLVLTNPDGYDFSFYVIKTKYAKINQKIKHLNLKFDTNWRKNMYNYSESDYGEFWRLFSYFGRLKFENLRKK